MGNVAKVIVLLAVSNVFMLSAWYFHLRQWQDRPWYVAAFLSWCIAFFEYAVHIPANRLGNATLTLPQLQILQVGLSLLFFMPFAALVMRRPVSLDFLWASLCLVGAVFFIFRENVMRPEAAPTVAQQDAAAGGRDWIPGAPEAGGRAGAMARDGGVAR